MNLDPLLDRLPSTETTSRLTKISIALRRAVNFASLGDEVAANMELASVYMAAPNWPDILRDAPEAGVI